MDRGSQEQTVVIDRGLFLVRYAAAKDKIRPPAVKISAGPRSHKHISFVLSPDNDKTVLSQPETCLVVKATGTSKLAIQVVPTRKGGSTAATVRIEPIQQRKGAPQVGPRKRENGASDLSEIRIVGHVTGIGDVVVGPNEWLAGPAAPSRIEGILLDWPDRPPGVDIRYAVKTARPLPISGQAVQLGDFAGTRGKAMPIISLMLELSGAEAENLQFVGEAIFLGAPAKRIEGRSVIASGPTGREPLVGLRLALEAARPAPRLKTTRRKLQKMSMALPESMRSPARARQGAKD